MSGVILKINEKLEQFSSSERTVAEYILNKPKEAVGLSVFALADNCKSSGSAVVRFCKSLGYSGYRSFTLDLTRELATQEQYQSSDYIDICVGDDRETIAKNVCLKSIEAIQESLKIIDFGQLNNAADILKKAKRIDFYGYGASSVVAMDAQQKFLRINKFATAYTDPHLQIASASMLGREGVAVAISWSGETTEIIDAALAAKKSGAAVIAVTKFSGNHLEKLADINLSLFSPEASIRCGATSSRIAQLTVIDILYNIIVSEEYENVRQYLDSTRGVVITHKYPSYNEAENKDK